MSNRSPLRSRPTHGPGRREGRASKKMTIIAVVLMLLALLGYVLSLDEELQPGGGGEQVPALAE